MKKTVLLFLAATLLFTAGCMKTPERITRQSFVFDTVINISAEKKHSKHIEEAIRQCNEYNLVFSRTNPESELYKINKLNHIDISEDIKEVLEFSVNLSEKTQGAFDITIEPLVRFPYFWNFISLPLLPLPYP